MSINRLPLTYPQMGAWPETQACALTGNRTSDLSVSKPVLNLLSHTIQRQVLNFKWSPLELGFSTGAWEEGSSRALVSIVRFFSNMPFGKMSLSNSWSVTQSAKPTSGSCSQAHCLPRVTVKQIEVWWSQRSQSQFDSIVCNLTNIYWRSYCSGPGLVPLLGLKISLSSCPQGVCRWVREMGRRGRDHFSPVS